MFNLKRKPATEGQQTYILLVKAAGCLMCASLDEREEMKPHHRYAEFNHHVRAGRRLGHDVGTGECQWHHRGEPLYGYTKAKMLRIMGPARNYQGVKGGFAARWGTDAELLEKQEAHLQEIHGSAYATGA